MSTLHSLRWQHDEASHIMLRLIHLVAAYRDGDNAFPIALQLAQWVGLMRAHLASEDAWFYPAMMASSDAEAAATATRFHHDMGDLAHQLESFDRRWSSSAVIAARFGLFRHEVRALFASFDNRMAKENDTLYTLAAAIGLGARPRAA